MINKTINFIAYFALAVVIINAFFIYPSADDYVYYVRQETYGFWAFQKWHYLQWGGRYVPNALLGIFNFEDNGIYLYRIVAVLIIAGFYSSLRFFIKNVVKAENTALVTNLIFISYCFSLYSISQEFYWMPGSITYTLSLMLCLLSWTLLAKSHNNSILFLNVLIIIILNGTNEISILFYNASLAMILIFKTITERSLNKRILFLFLISVSCMLISIMAPGNTVRTLSEVNKSTHDILFSVSRAAYRTFFFLAERLFIFVILGIFLYKELSAGFLRVRIPFIRKTLLKILTLIFPIAILFLGILPSYYATGKIPPERTVNTISFFFLIAVVFSVMFYLDNFSENRNRTLKPKLYIPVIIVLLIGFYPNDLRNNIYDLFSGRSAQFAKEMQMRLEYLKTTDEQNVRVKKIKVLPNTLLFRDISNNSDSFFNRYYAKFYKKKSVAAYE